MDDYILLSVDTVVVIDVSIVRCIDCSNRLVMLGATPPRNTRSPEAVFYMYCNVISFCFNQFITKDICN